MEKLEHTLKPQQRVKLKDGYDECYTIARSGAVAYVIDVKEDPMGYPCALIKWDRNHWTYDGESDGWAYQSHFEPIEGTMPEGSDKQVPDPLELIKDVDPQLLAQVIMAIKAAQGDDPEVTVDNLKAAQLADAKRAVTEEIEDTEAFLLISIRRVEEEGEAVLDPQVISFSKTEEGVLAVEAQMNALLHMSIEALIMEKLGRVMEEQGAKVEGE